MKQERFSIFFSLILLIAGYFVGRRHGFGFEQILLFDNSLPWDIENLIVGFYAGTTCGTGIMMFSIIEAVILKIREEREDNIKIAENYYGKWYFYHNR